MGGGGGGKPKEMEKNLGGKRGGKMGKVKN